MQTILGWAFVLGIVFNIVGAGGTFQELTGGLLTIALMIGGILIMVGAKRPREVLIPVLGAALALAFIPSFIASVIHDEWRSLSWGAVFLIGITVIVIALIITRERQ